MISLRAQEKIMTDNDEMLDGETGLESSIF